MSTFWCWYFVSVHFIHLLKHLIHFSNIILCKFHLPASEMFCFHVIMQQERLFKVITIYLSHFFNLFFLWPLSACVSAHSTPNRSPTHSPSISVFFTVFTALCSLYIPAFNCTKCLVVVSHTHRPTACYTTRSSGLSVCSHLPVGRTVHNQCC